jgi:hypothetical protein
MKRYFMIAVLFIFCIFGLYMKNSLEANASALNQKGKIGTYMVNFSEVDLSSVSHYANLFNINEEFLEDETAFIFKNEHEKLSVYKHLNQIRYDRLGAKVLEKQVLQSDVDAAKTAVSFFQKKRLPFKFEEVLVGFNGELYKVIFIEQLSGINLYAFNNTVTIDIYGNIVSADYFYHKFSKYGSCEMLNARAACEREEVFVPKEVFENAKISVIYIYEDSIIVPGYLIEGLLNDGSCFRSIVNGAVFG